jgi:SAM-dependent methyltransferase
MEHDLQLEREPTQNVNSGLEVADCPNGCESANDAVLHEFGEYGVCRCARCGLVRLSPRLSESSLEEFYGRDYFSGDHGAGYDRYDEDRALYERTFARRLKLIRRFKPRGRLLDIGCGFGYFLSVAQRAGYEPHGLDLSAHAVERSRAVVSADAVRQGSLAPGLYPEKYFDVITMSDLFEHVYRPREFARTLHGITKDDGVIVITTPNQKSLLARVSGRRWVSYKIPEHVFYYTPATLRRAVAPWFEIAHERSDGQFCTLEFLAERVKTLSRPVGALSLYAVRALGVSRVPVYVNSGSMTVVLKKRRAVES